jgi:hypothetical protein
VSNQIVLNYAVSFSEKVGIEEVSKAFLNKVGFVTQTAPAPAGSDGGATPVKQTKAKSAKATKDAKAEYFYKEIYSATEAEAYTAENVSAFFEAGLNAIYLIMQNNPGDWEKLDTSKFYSLVFGDGFSVDNAETHIPEFDGVRYVSAVDDSQHLSQGVCILVSSVAAMQYAVGSLLDYMYWRNQQYLQLPSTISNTFAVKHMSFAKAFFDKRLSFFLDDDELGQRLGFFGVHDDPVVKPYIKRQIELEIQQVLVDYIALNEPTNTALERANLEESAQDIIDTYTQPPYSYLDADSENSVSIIKSNKRYIVNGSITMDVPDPIWRVEIEAEVN